MSKELRPLFQQYSGCLCIGGLPFAIVCSSYASNLNFLNDTPLSHMKQRDVDSIEMAAT
jgi:hypothetical protein